jgi:ATP-dependent Clp protease ATP-binding subunit ClpA
MSSRTQHLDANHRTQRTPRLSSVYILRQSRHRIATIGSAAEVPSNGYGPSIRNVLRLSSQHAETLGDSEIEPERFALGLLDKADGPAINLLRHFTVDTERLKTLLLQKISNKSP